MTLDEYDDIIKHLVAIALRQDTLMVDQGAINARLTTAIEGINTTLARITAMLPDSPNGH